MQAPPRQDKLTRQQYESWKRLVPYLYDWYVVVSQFAAVSGLPRFCVCSSTLLRVLYSSAALVLSGLRTTRWCGRRCRSNGVRC